jgi:glycosyltransferase involved in cell wall biosynthesis
MKIALVHDYLREYGGAERVLEVFHELWPDAPLFTSFVDWDGLGVHSDIFKTWDIRPSWVQHNWLVRKFHSPLRFLTPFIWNSFDLSDYDVVLSSSGWFMCRGVHTKKNDQTGALHVCYIHHPPRNLYGYETGGLVQRYKVVKMYASIINFFLRQYDYDTAQQVDYFIANSQETARRVKKFYRRDSLVMYPPIQVKKPKVLKEPGSYYISVGRLTYSKRIDILIEACNSLQLPLKIIGTGKEEFRLRQIAGPTIEFLGALSDEEVSTMYSQAKALLFCARQEDFGMVPVEAMAHGVPVLALKEGGVKETIIHGKTGLFFSEPSVDSLREALNSFEKMDVPWAEYCISRAQFFSVDVFKKQITTYIQEKRKDYARITRS